MEAKPKSLDMNWHEQARDNSALDSLICELLGWKETIGMSDDVRRKNFLMSRAAEKIQKLRDVVEYLSSAITVRNADVTAMFERAQAVEAFVEDMHAVGRLRLTPEWQERMERVMRFRKRELQQTD